MYNILSLRVMLNLLCLTLQEDLYYRLREEQVQLLQKVLAATDEDAEEEQVIGALTGRTVRRPFS